MGFFFLSLVFDMPLCASVYTPKESSNAYTFVLAFSRN